MPQTLAPPADKTPDAAQKALAMVIEALAAIRQEPAGASA